MVILDIYPLDNANAEQYLREVHPSTTSSSAVSQSWTSQIEGILTSSTVRLKKYGAPEGNLIVRMYLISGSYGTGSVPSGSSLASSNLLSIASLYTYSSNFTVTFTGSDQIIVGSGSAYCISIEVEDATTLNGTNYVAFLMDSSTPTASGNIGIYSSSAWKSFPTIDLVYVNEGFAFGYKN